MFSPHTTQVIHNHDTGGDRVHVGIATYDSTLHFYNLATEQGSPQMLVVPDVKDVYAPLAGSLVVPLAERRALVEQLLEQIPTMFSSSNASDTAGGAAMQAAVEVLKVGMFGVIWFCSSPSCVCCNSALVSIFLCDNPDLFSQAGVGGQIFAFMATLPKVGSTGAPHPPTPPHPTRRWDPWPLR